MSSYENVCGQRITYEPPIHENLSVNEAVLYEDAYFEVENTLAIIAKSQNERTNEDGEITEPLTHTQIRTILELGLTILGTLGDTSEGTQ